jgi:hypothetical protein
MTATTTDVEIALRLADQGVPLEVISNALNQPMGELVRSLKRTVLTPEDEQLANGMRQLAWKAWGEAMWILNNGHPDQKLVLLRTILGKVAGLIGQESTTSHEETKQAVNRIWAQMRDVPAAPDITALPVPDTDTTDAVESASAFGRAYDPGVDAPPDEGPARLELDPWR